MIKHVNLDQDGLGLFLGRAEISIMRALWNGPKNVSGVHNFITKNDRPMAYSTVHTILVRLTQKGLVDRFKPVGEIATYAAIVETEYEFVDRCMLSILETLCENHADSFARNLSVIGYHTILDCQ